MQSGDDGGGSAVEHHPPPDDGYSLSLQRVLEARGAPLAEAELWAVCLNVTRAMAEGANAGILATTLSVHLCPNGTIALVAHGDDNLAEVLEQYQPPELEGVDAWWETPTETTQVFALAATLYAAADHCLPEDEEPSLNEEMELLLSSMADDDVSERADLDTIRELAAAGLMLCLDSECEGEAETIIRRLVNDARAASSSPSQDPNGPDHTSPLSVRRRPPEADAPSEWDTLLAELQSPRTLRSANDRVLPPPTTKHVSGVDVPATYVTPHEALMQDIAAGSVSLKHIEPPMSRHALVTLDGGRDEAGQTAKGSVVATDGDSTARATSHPSKPGQKRKLLKPCSSVSNLFDDWNPERQVQLGFLAESAKPKSADPPPVVVPVPPPPETVGTSRSSDNETSSTATDGLSGTTAAATSRSRRRKLSAGPLSELIATEDDMGNGSGVGGAGSTSGTPKSARKKEGGMEGFGSASKPAYLQHSPRQPALRNGHSRSQQPPAAASAQRPATSTLDKARSLFRRKSSDINVWSAARAKVRRSSQSPPTSPGADGRYISLTDWRHIRASLVKAELEDLFDSNPGQVTYVIQQKACACCGVRFGRFKWGRTCLVCSLSSCSACSFKFDAPAHMRQELDTLEFDRTKGPMICSDCHKEMAPS
eukprot:m.205956 g.205956  ORF g.205956 m.205956 type:complete len:653 (+) comp23146_c0_seq1:254-2212(+)